MTEMLPDGSLPHLQLDLGAAQQDLDELVRDLFARDRTRTPRSAGSWNTGTPSRSSSRGRRWSPSATVARGVLDVLGALEACAAQSQLELLGLAAFDLVAAQAEEKLVLAEAVIDGLLRDDSRA
jgi:hypothetical protein